MNLYINDISYQPRSVLANPHNLINDFVDVCERAKKYSFENLRKRQGIFSQIKIGKKLKEVSAVPGLDVQLFFERVVLSFLLGNGDAHFKNFSISYQDEGVRLERLHRGVDAGAVADVGVFQPGLVDVDVRGLHPAERLEGGVDSLPQHAPAARDVDPCVAVEPHRSSSNRRR